MQLVLLARLVAFAQKLCLIQVHLYLLSQKTAIQLTGVEQQPLPQVQLQTAPGELLPIIDYVSVDVQLNTMSTSIHYNFLVVTSLIAPVIWFFQQHGLILDFTKLTIQIYPKQDDIPDVLHLEYCSTTKTTHKTDCSFRESSTDISTDCAIPDYGALQHYYLPECQSALFSKVISQYKQLFCTVLGHTLAAAHHIPTKGSPICIPPRCVPARVETGSGHPGLTRLS